MSDAGIMRRAQNEENSRGDRARTHRDGLLASREQADFTVAFTVGARDLINVDDYPLGYRGRRPWSARYFGTGADVTTYTEGTLAIDIFDNGSRQPVWHGWARKRITGGDIEDPAPTIDAAVRAILAGFPPDS